MIEIISVKEEETTTNYVTEIIDSPPGFLLRSGILMVTIIMSLILFLISFISYPDKIECIGQMDSEYPSVELLSSTEGVIQKTYIKNNETLEIGDSILLIQNGANHNDVKLLDSILQHFHLDIQLPKSLNLGIMEADYLSLSILKKERDLFLSQNRDWKKMKSIKGEIDKLNLLNKSHEERFALFEEEINLQKVNLKRTGKLVADGVATQVDKEKAESSMLKLKQKREGMRTEIIQNEIKIDKLTLQRTQIEDEAAYELKRFQNEIDKLISRLKVGSKTWKNEYLIISPAEGTLVFNSNIFLNKHLLKNESIGFVVRHEKSNKKLIKAQFSVKSIGKLNIGDRAIIKFEAYPHKEFGIITSEIKDISLIPLKDEEGKKMYEITIPLQDPLITSYNKSIKFKPNASVRIVVILEERSLFQRIFEQFLSLLRNS